MTQTGKAVALISSFGAVGGVGAYAGGLFSSKEDEQKEIESTQLVATVSNRLADEGFLVLDTNKDKDWKEVLDAYNDAGTKKNLFSEPKAQIQTIKELQQKCAEIIDKEKDTTNSYTLAKQWCVKKEKIENILGRKNLKLLNADEPEEGPEKQIWTERVAELIKNKEKFKIVELKEEEAAVGDNIKALKAGCKGLNTTTLFTTSEGFGENLELTKEWCSTSSK